MWNANMMWNANIGMYHVHDYTYYSCSSTFWHCHPHFTLQFYTIVFYTCTASTSWAAAQSIISSGLQIRVLFWGLPELDFCLRCQFWTLFVTKIVYLTRRALCQPPAPISMCKALAIHLNIYHATGCACTQLLHLTTLSKFVLYAVVKLLFVKSNS